ncbi:hypothetical protein [Paraburkholderia youngii]|uniref:hypothetical protein n=1 Tax=Paraburkholderia youngii TaxID=2782701 RepID=UPI0015950F3B|nr:hypothetical protein [Paraburkholderia youngii]
MNAIIVKLGTGMNAKCDNDAVRSVDMGTGNPDLNVASPWAGDYLNSEYQGNYRAIRLNPWMLRTKRGMAKQLTDQIASTRHQNGAATAVRRTRTAQ